VAVFMMDPFFFSGLMPSMQIVQELQAADVDNELVQIPYNNLLPTLANSVAAVNMLDSYVTNTATYPGPNTVVGLSMGAEMIDKWLRDKGPTSAVSPSNLSFVLLADPEHRYNGATVRAPTVFPPAYGGVGLPAATPYHAIVFTRQYDGFADYPNVDNPIAISNALVGQGLIHTDYGGESLYDSDLFSLTQGNVVYKWSRTSIIPLTTATFGLFPDSIFRQVVEASYSRPVDLEGTGPPPPIMDLDLISLRCEYLRKHGRVM
jgi:hypothetical protein